MHAFRHAITAILLICATSAASQKDALRWRAEVVLGGLKNPWGLAFLPDGSALVTERPGGLRHIANGRATSITGVPRVLNEGQAGLFDVVADPGFAQNRQIWLSYAAGTRRSNALTLARGRLDGNRLADVQVVHQLPAKRGNAHYGGRIAFLADGSLLLTTGDGFDFREQAQLPDSELGKVLRITPDGKAAIFTLGHRNPQGLAVDPVRGMIFEHEHGPRGGDEVNILAAGKNYGWPIATRGRDYSGATISPFRSYAGMQEPLLSWTPSMAPSGLAVYRGAMFPEWNGDLLVGALVDKEVRRIRLSPAGEVLGQESLFQALGERIRSIVVAPDGAIWLTTDAPSGRVIRISR